jgi:hypothetical protein
MIFTILVMNRLIMKLKRVQILKFEIAIYLKESASTHISKKIGSIKIYLSTFGINSTYVPVCISVFKLIFYFTVQI